MDEKSMKNIPFVGEKGKWRMWLGKFTARSRIKGYNILLTGYIKIPADDTEETKDKGVT